MGRRARRGLAFVVVAFLGLRALAFVSASVAPAEASEYHDYRAMVRSALAQAPSLTAITVGDSHNEAIDFQALGLRGYHLWWPRSDVLEAGYVAETLLPHLPRLRVVFLALSPGLLSLDNASAGAGVVRREMYAATRSGRPLPGDVANYVLGRLAPILPIDVVARRDHWKGVLSAIGSGTGRVVSAPPDASGQTTMASFVSCAGLAGSPAQLVSLAHQKQVDFVGAIRRTTASPRALQALRRLAGALARRHVRLVLYTPPYPRPLVEAVPDTTWRATQTAVRPLLHRPDVTYVDLSHDPSFIDRLDLFRNIDHLNRCGARAVSGALRAKLGVGVLAGR